MAERKKAPPHSEWPRLKELARQMRQDGKGIPEICAATGLADRAIYNAVKGIDFVSRDVSWHAKAREMRANGAKISEIAAVVGRGPTQVGEAVRGVVCPVDHVKKLTMEAARQTAQEKREQRARERALAALAEPPKPRPTIAEKTAWHEEARRMRAEGKKVSEIVAALGKSTKRVEVVVKGVKCPVDHRLNAARANASRRSERKIEMQAQGLLPPPKPKQRKPVEPRVQLAPRPKPKPYEPTPEERAAHERRKIVRHMIFQDANRKPPPVTLPRISIQFADL